MLLFNRWTHENPALCEICAQPSAGDLHVGGIELPRTYLDSEDRFHLDYRKSRDQCTSVWVMENALQRFRTYLSVIQFCQRTCIEKKSRHLAIFTRCYDGIG